MPSAKPLPAQTFDIVETTIDDIHAAYKAGTLTVRQLVQMYLDRIAAYDKNGPAINAIISLNPTAFEEADRLDAALPGRPASSFSTRPKSVTFRPNPHPQTRCNKFDQAGGENPGCIRTPNLHPTSALENDRAHTNRLG